MFDCCIRQSCRGIIAELLNVTVKVHRNLIAAKWFGIISGISFTVILGLSLLGGWIV